MLNVFIGIIKCLLFILSIIDMTLIIKYCKKGEKYYD